MNISSRVKVMHSTHMRGFSIIPLTVHNSGTMPSGSFAKVNASVERHTALSHGCAGNSSDVAFAPSTSKIDRTSTPTRASSRKRRGHVVNLVHVRSRSLSQTQFPPSLASSLSSDRPTALFRSNSKDQDIPSKNISPRIEVVEHSSEDAIKELLQRRREETKSSDVPHPKTFFSTDVSRPAPSRTRSATVRQKACALVRGQSAKNARVSTDSNVSRGAFVRRPKTAAVQGNYMPDEQLTTEHPGRSVPLSDTISVESL
jgi:hypothetical protein